MIISNPYELVFVTTPKSGSLTGFTLMREYFQASGEFNHLRRIPSNCKHYHSFTFVRNPYERFCALYHSIAIANDTYYDIVPEYARKSILDYAKWNTSNNLKKFRGHIPGLFLSQEAWHRGGGVKEFIHIEKAAEVFTTRYPELNIQFPHNRKRDHSTWDEVKTEALLYFVNIWAGADFKEYGYKKELNISS